MFWGVVKAEEQKWVSLHFWPSQGQSLGSSKKKKKRKSKSGIEGAEDSVRREKKKKQQEIIPVAYMNQARQAVTTDTLLSCNS